MIPVATPLLAFVALAGALMLRSTLVRRPDAAGVATALLDLLALIPFAWLVATPGAITLPRAGLAAALAAAVLARDRGDLAQGECALKLTWTFAVALALTWAGESLLAIAAGSAVPREQWPALALELDPYALWTSALTLTLLAGVVLLGGAPFHFWVADLLQGARAWLAPLLVAALQVAGAALLAHRLEGIGAFAPGAMLVRGTLALAAGLALLGGAATLAGQRRPERRVGTLASLQGALVLASLAADPERGVLVQSSTALSLWAAHLALALTGAGALARFMPVDPTPDAPAAALFRRHPWSAAVGAYALLSLAGVPGTPGARLWLAVARMLAATRHPVLLAALALAWLVAFAVTADAVRRSFGSPSAEPPAARPVPWIARAALWTATVGLALLFVPR